MFWPPSADDSLMARVCAAQCAASATRHTSRQSRSSARQPRHFTWRSRQPRNRVRQATGRVRQAIGRVRQATGRVRQATGRVRQVTGRVRQATGRVRQVVWQPRQAARQRAKYGGGTAQQTPCPAAHALAPVGCSVAFSHRRFYRGVWQPKTLATDADDCAATVALKISDHGPFSPHVLIQRAM